MAKTENQLETAPDGQNSGHTPGPWYFRKDGMTIESVHRTGFFLSIANMSGKHIFSSEETIANARLICAAPDLLAALEELVTGHSLRGEEMARAAIAKAKGVTK